MRALFMLTTELISIPTGFIFLVAMGTFWKAKIRFTVPMLFALGMLFNFLIVGVAGGLLSVLPPGGTEPSHLFSQPPFQFPNPSSSVLALFCAHSSLLRNR